MIELVKQGKQKEALDFFSTQKGASILNEYYELNNYFGEKEQEILDAATSNAQENLRFLVSAVTEIAATVEQHKSTATQLSSYVNQTTITMDELGAASQQSAKLAQAGAECGLQALTIAERESLAVEQTLESMIILKENVKAIAQQIMRLNEQTNQIGNISSVVTDLANQTNILALNAAVEAVRAGENAKGFNVLATEIRLPSSSK